LKLIHKYPLVLVLLNVLLIIAAYLVVSGLKLNLYFSDIVILSSSFSIIAFVTLLIFFKGQPKEPDSQTLYILTAISLKFLLEIIFALIWFIVAKKTSLPSVLMFFVLYLSLSLFSIWVILKTLKNRAL
jgi:F0F1-type ATP synthase assembly protein I